VASYVIGLANCTGWTEHFILWELPLSRGLQYQHAALALNGVKTVPTEEGLKKELGDIVAQLKKEQEKQNGSQSQSQDFA
jgi:hypothetical protein